MLVMYFSDVLDSVSTCNLAIKLILERDLSSAIYYSLSG